MSPIVPSAWNHAYPRVSTDGLELVEVVDGRDRPVAVAPLREVHRQMLCHRAVLVLVHDTENRVFLQKRSLSKPLYPGCWDLSATGHVRAGESREAAALRELEEELGICAESLHLKHSIPAGAHTGNEFVTLYAARARNQVPRPNPDELAGGMFVDQDELDYLAATFRELLTPGLVHFWEHGLIF
jgi:isopentenyl-diphosphate delta-isomerase